MPFCNQAFEFLNYINAKYRSQFIEFIQYFEFWLGITSNLLPIRIQPLSLIAIINWNFLG